MKKTILFADDEPWFHEPIRLALESKGFECLCATDVTSAMEIIALRDVEVAVVDVMMPAGSAFPSMDSQEAGFHLVKKLRDQWPHVEIICLSVIGDASKVELIRKLRADYLRKGEVPLARVVETIERAAAHERGGRVWRF